MPKEFTKEQFWKLYKGLPRELKDALFAEETGNNIFAVCEKNDVGDNLRGIVDYVGQVLIGVLPPEDFQQTLEKELKLKKDTAKKIAQEINRFVFFPVKESLAALYKIESVSPAKPIMLTQEKPEIKSAATKTEEETPSRQPEKDTYREPIG